MNALPIVKFWRVWVLGLVLACLGAPALAWDDALIQAVYAVTFGRANEAQKALVFANNKVVNQMAMTNIIDNKAYQASQKLFSDINNTFIQKAAKEAGLKAGLQPPSGEGYNPGTDTDVLVDSAKQGEKITLENIKKAEEAYQRQLRQFLESRGVKPPAGKIDTQTDFMPNSRSTTPSEFTKINQHINANGGTAYESPGAADVEWKMRLDKNDPLRKLNINETGEYMNEMQRLAKEKLSHAEALEAEARQALKTDPAKARGLQSDAQLARSQAGKYMQRMEKVSNELAKQHGVPGVPKSEGPLGQSIENISKEGRGFDTRGDARNIGKYGEAGVNKGVKDYAETLSKIAAKSKDPKAIAEAQRQIAEQTKNMKPDMREYIAKKAKEAFKGEGKAAEEFEKGLTKEMDKQAAKASAEGAGKGGTEGAAKGGTEGAAKGGTEGAAKGGTEGAAQGGTEGAAKGGTEGAAQGGTEGARRRVGPKAQGWNRRCSERRDRGAAQGGNWAAKGGTEGARKVAPKEGGTEGAAKGGTEGAAQGGTEGAAKGGTEGAAKGGTEGAAKGGTEGAAQGGTEGAAKGGTEGAAQGKAEPKVRKVAPKAPPRVALKAPRKVAPKAQRKAVLKAPRKGVPKAPPRVEPRVQRRAEPKVRPRVEPRVPRKAGLRA
ncbi:MAG: hypothetical protein IPG66_02170 [Hydrogenophilales bacterium]|nr:hypothetical protein [Hydrogenophilales bacterium]